MSNSKTYITLFILAFWYHTTNAASCEIFPPNSTDGNEIGFIFVPGAQIKGEAYGPLSFKIQSLFPGKMWVGLTEGWFGNFPNPLEVSGAIADCYSKASAAGLSTTKVFQAGHSLGGIVLETWARDHADVSSGIIVFGSYLPNGFGGQDGNLFPVPVLTAVGNLDGGAISYVTREARESKDPSLGGKFPVFVIDNVNHAQVASGIIPEVVIDNDVDAEVDNEEAFIRYARPAIAFMVINAPDGFDAEVIANSELVMQEYQSFTDEFLEPFQKMKILEQSLDNSESKWVKEVQKVIGGVPNSEAVSVSNIVVEFSDLGDFKPQLTQEGNCQVSITTAAYNSYPLDPLDFGGLISADVTKAKFKLEDVIQEGICSDSITRKQCKDANIRAYEVALAVSSDEARNRFLSKGRQIVFADDYNDWWGPGWEFSFNLYYTKLNETHVEIGSHALISEPDFIIESAAGMHYCDLLSPYRALEWIYIRGVQHGEHY